MDAMAERHRRVLSPRVAEALLWAAVFFCPLALGTYAGWPILVMLLLASLALAAAALAARRLELPVAGLGLAAVAIYTGLQAVPLPPWLLGLLSPQGADTYRFGLEGAAAGSWHPLTLDGPATARELVKALAVAAAFLAAYQVGGSRRSRRRLAQALAGAGLTLVLIGYGHLLANAHELFGLPFFKEASPPFVTPFGNKNNAAGFFSLCAPVALGLALRGRDRRVQALWGLAYVLIGAAMFLCLSRGGICAFLVAQLAFGALLWLDRERTRGPAGRSPRSPRAAVGVICAAAVAVSIAGFLGYEPVMARLATLDSVESVRQEGKLQGFVQSLALLRDFPLTGIGRGAFPTVGGHYLTVAPGTAEFIENEPLQALADWGLPVGGALVLLLAWAFSRALSRPGLGPLEYGLATGLLALGLQNLVDFSLELGGLALPAAVALALLCRRPPEEDSPPARELAVPGRWAAAGAAAALAIGAAAFPLSLRDWRSETDGFAAAAPKLSVAQAEAEALPVLERHPASFVVPLSLAERFLAVRKPAHALHWLNRALYFKPNVAAMHLVAEGALAELGLKAQCLLEARLYFEQSGGAFEGLAVARSKYASLADLEEAVPATGRGLSSLGSFLENLGRRDDALAATRAAIALAPEDSTIHRRLAALLLARGDTGAAVDEAERARACAPDDPESYLALSTALSAAGKREGARSALIEGLHRQPGQPELVFALVGMQLAQGHAREADQALSLVGAAPTLAQRAQLFELRARIYETEGRSAKAEEALRSAARLQPGYRWELAGYLEQQSQLRAAIQILRELAAESDGAGRTDIARRIAADEQRQRALDDMRHEALLLAPRGDAEEP